MIGQSLGIDVNVQVREIDRHTGTIMKKLIGHNRITKSGLQAIGDYISGYFDASEVMSMTDEQIRENALKIAHDFKKFISILPACVHLGTSTVLEAYTDTDVKTPIVYPQAAGEALAGKTVTLNLSSGSSTMQSALMSSLSTLSIDGYDSGITLSYVALSSSETFESFQSRQDGTIVDGSDNPINLTELSLMNKDASKCWARIAFTGLDAGIVLNKKRVYDVLWNVNLVSIPTQAKSVIN